MANNGNNKEPENAPEADRWYDLTLGSSFKPRSTSKFFTLRYDFKPASIDKNQAGSLHKSKENRVTVDFQNNQPGKPKVMFEGSSEDYKDNDCVLFFDGESFRLERLHRAVKRLKYVRQHGEPSAATVAPVTSSVGSAMESRSPPLGKTAKAQPLNKTILHPAYEVERIDVGEPESPGQKPTGRTADNMTGLSNLISASPNQKNYEVEENLDLVVDDDEETPIKTKAVGRAVNTGFDINLPNQNDTDDDIADVDDSDDEADKGPNTAEALRAQVNAKGREGQTSSSSGSSSSGSSGSGSGSGSSSSDSSGSDDDSASSGGDVDI